MRLIRFDYFDERRGKLLVFVLMLFIRYDSLEFRREILDEYIILEIIVSFNV